MRLRAFRLGGTNSDAFDFVTLAVAADARQSGYLGMEARMAVKVRVNLANEQELLELPGLGPAEAAASVRFRSEHGPIKDPDQLAEILQPSPPFSRNTAAAASRPAA